MFFFWVSHRLFSTATGETKLSMLSIASDTVRETHRRDTGPVRETHVVTRTGFTVSFRPRQVDLGGLIQSYHACYHACHLRSGAADWSRSCWPHMTWLQSEPGRLRAKAREETEAEIKTMETWRGRPHEIQEPSLKYRSIWKTSLLEHGSIRTYHAW